MDRRGVLDDIVKARTLVRLPEVDEMFVCGPKVFMSDDVRALAASLGVGLVALTDSGDLEWLAPSTRLEPARLTLNGAYIKGSGNPRFNAVRPGGKVRFNAAVFNGGDKMAVNVEVFMVPAPIYRPLAVEGSCQEAATGKDGTCGLVSDLGM